MTYTKNGKTFHFPVEERRISSGKVELQKALPGVNTKMLTKQLRELEEDGIIRRKIYPEVPPRVEYAITEFGKTLIPILEALCTWGAEYLGVDEGSPNQCPTKAGKKRW
jgi:DNA-binding HxlR family transcriptional regulator